MTILNDSMTILNDLQLNGVSRVLQNDNFGIRYNDSSLSLS